MFHSLWLHSWQLPTVCLFYVFTELPLAIYPVVPPLPHQSSRVQANWHSRCSTAERPICSDRYPSQEAFIPGGKGRKIELLLRRRLNGYPAGRMCLLLAVAGDCCVWVQRVIHTTEKSVVRGKTYLGKHCSICHLVISAHWRCSWAPDKFLWFSPSSRSVRTGQRQDSGCHIYPEKNYT